MKDVCGFLVAFELLKNSFLLLYVDSKKREGITNILRFMNVCVLLLKNRDRRKNEMTESRLLKNHIVYGFYYAAGRACILVEIIQDKLKCTKRRKQVQKEMKMS